MSTMATRAKNGEIVDAPLKLHKKSGLFFREETSDKSMIKDCLKNYQAVYDHPSIKGSRVLDLGANIGAFAKLALKAGAEHVVCIEAEPTNIEMIKLNLKEELEKGVVTVIFAAMVPADQDSGSVTFYFGNSKSVQCSGSTVASSARPNKIEVPTISFGNLDDNVHYSIVKCDIEGGEYGLLREGVLQTHRSVLALEFHAAAAENRKSYEEWLPKIQSQMETAFFKDHIVFGAHMNTDVVFYAR